MLTRRATPIMDNKEFDHIIKGKLESLNPPYKEGAWEDLHYKLDLLAPLPWYARWKTALIAGSLALITLINVGVLYKVNENQAQMQEILNELNSAQASTVPQTLYVTTSDDYLGSLLSTTVTTDKPLGSLSNLGYRLDLKDPDLIYQIREAAQKSLPSSFTLQNTPTNPLLDHTSGTLKGATDDYFGLLAQRPVESLDALDPFAVDYQQQGLDAENLYVRGIVVPSSKRKWDHPLDLRAGIATGYLIPDPDLGERFVSSRQGIYLETPIRRNIHALTGLSYQELTYKLDDVDDNNFSQSTLMRYPDYGTFDSDPDEIKVDNQILQLPLYVRFYQPLNNKWSVFVGGGPTLDLLLKQKFTYSFLEIQNEQLVEFEEIRTSNKSQLSIGSISGNMGIEHYFSRRLSAQMEINYQYGLGKIGVENRSFNSLSISGGLFYKLRAR